MIRGCRARGNPVNSKQEVESKKSEAGRRMRGIATS
jgi:hypothetical protein